MAIHAQVPILPVAIIDATKIWPADSHLKLKRGTCKLKIGKPIETKGYTLTQVNELKDLAYNELYEMLTIKV